MGRRSDQSLGRATAACVWTAGVLPLFAFACAAPSARPEPTPPSPAHAIVEAPRLPASVAALPVAENVAPDMPEDVPTISVTRGEVLLDGQRVDDTRAFDGNDGLHKLEGEFEALKARREAWRASHPGHRLPGIVLHRFEADLPVSVAKSVFQAAAFAAYPNASFIVRIAGSARVGHILVDAHVPSPPGSPQPTLLRLRRLDVEMMADRFVLTWRKGDVVESTSTVPRHEVTRRDAFGELVSFPDLAAAIAETWRAHGDHKEPSDATLDTVGLHVGNHEPFRLLVAMVDAASAPKRDIAHQGRILHMNAFNVVLHMR